MKKHPLIMFLLLLALLLTSCGEDLASELPSGNHATEEQTTLPTEKESASIQASADEEMSTGESEVPTEEASSEASLEETSDESTVDKEEPTSEESKTQEMPTEAKTEEASTEAPTEKPTSEEVTRESIDYDEYLSIDEKEYIDQTLKVPYLQYVSEKDIDEAIRNTLLKYGSLANVNDRAAVNGDTVNIYYQGVLTDAEGKETAFSGGTYMSFGKPYALTLGSGQFIDGFEEALVGVIPKDTYRFESEDESLAVASDSLIRFDYTAVYQKDGEDKTKSGSNMLVYLPKQKMGEAFSSELVGAKVGESRTFEIVCDIDGDKTEENVSMTVKVLDIAVLNPCEVFATFPESYPSNPDLAGKTVKFYVWVESITVKVPAELDEKFVTETMKVKVEEGEDAVEVFREYVRKSLQSQRDENVKNAVLNAAWDNLLQKTVFKKLPEDKIKAYYEEEMAMLKDYFDYYGAYYGCKTIEEFAPIYFGEREEIADLEAYVTAFAEDLLKQELILNYLCLKHGFAIDDATLAEEVEKFFKEEADYANSQNPSANYTAESMRQELEALYGVGYFEEYVAEQINTERLNEFLLSCYSVIYTEE